MSVVPDGQPAVAPIDRRFCCALLAAAFAVHLWFSLQGLANRPVDGHEFRQTQTAFAIREMAAHGLELDARLPVLGNPQALPFEFPLYQWATAAISRATSLPPEPLARLVSIAFFYLSIPFLRRSAAFAGLTPTQVTLGTAALLCCPIYLFYSRGILIESTALCCSAAFLSAACWNMRRSSPARMAAGAACAALAAAVKVTTFAVFLVPATLILLRQFRSADSRQSRRRLLTAAALQSGAGIAAGLAWSRHADWVRSQNPLARFLRDSELVRWVFGDPAMRLDPGYWTSIGGTITGCIAASFWLVVLLVPGLGVKRDRTMIVSLLGCFLAGPLVFANVYRIHDYYFYAVAVFLIGALGIGLAHLVEASRLPRAARWAFVAGFLGTGVLMYARTYHRLIPFNELRVPEPARQLRDLTHPGETIVILGQEWNPVYPYLAGRHALMFPEATETNAALRKAAVDRLDEPVGAVAVFAPNPGRMRIARQMAARLSLRREPMEIGDGSFAFPRRDQLNAGTRYGGEAPVLIPGGRHAIPSLSDAQTHNFSMMDPLPVEVASEFGAEAALVGRELWFSAHPVTELVFAVSGEHRLHAQFAIIPQAYADPAKSTDGVEFEAVLAREGQPDRTLVRRLLCPAREPGDRGVQTWDVSLPPDCRGSLVFRTLPGPAGNKSYDWAYWRSISIR